MLLARKSLGMVEVVEVDLEAPNVRELRVPGKTKSCAVRLVVEDTAKATGLPAGSLPLVLDVDS